MNNLISIFLILLCIPFIILIMIYLLINKYKKNNISKKISGFEITYKILEDNGLNKLYIVENEGFLSDQYDFKRNVIRLNKDNFNNNTISCVSISSFYGTLATNKKYIKFRSKFDYLLNYSLIIMYALFILGIFMSNTNVLAFSICLEVINLIYDGYIVIMNKSIINKCINNLVKYKIIKKEEVNNINYFLSKYYLKDLCNIFLNIKNN